MPVPAEYRRASDEFYMFLVDARDLADLWSTHVTYTMTQGVFQTFRRRLKVKDAISFANILPVGLRALFVADWNIEEPIKPFEDRKKMEQEVKSLREKHNFSPDNAISIVATVLRKHIDQAVLDKLLATLPAGATEFWEPMKEKK